MDPGNFLVRGDRQGVIPIASVTFIPGALAAGSPATGTIVLTFAAPLADDRYTLTISDALVDPAGNALDGQSNLLQPTGTPLFPSGDGQPGGDFAARFTLDGQSRDRRVECRQRVPRSERGLFVRPERDGRFPPRSGLRSWDSPRTISLPGISTGTASTNWPPIAAWPTVTSSGSRRLAVPVVSYPTFAASPGIPVAANFSPGDPGDEVGVFTGKRLDSRYGWRLHSRHHDSDEHLWLADCRGFQRRWPVRPGYAQRQQQYVLASGRRRGDHLLARERHSLHRGARATGRRGHGSRRFRRHRSVGSRSERPDASRQRRVVFLGFRWSKLVEPRCRRCGPLLARSFWFGHLRPIRRRVCDSRRRQLRSALGSARR